MKKIILVITTAAVVAFSTPSFALITVIDNAAISRSIREGVSRAAEAKAILDQAVAEYEQAKQFSDETKRRLEGYTDYANLFNTAESYLKDNLSELGVPDDINKLRDDYGVVSSDPAVQEQYDQMLKRIALFENFNKQLTSTAKQLDRLQNSFNDAITPQQKQDVSNQLQLEMLKQQSVMQQYTFAQEQIKVDREISSEKSAQEWLDAHRYNGD